MSLRCMLGFHDIPDQVDEPGYYACGRCGKRERRIDWQNLEIRGNTIYRNNMGEGLMKRLAEFEKMRKAIEGKDKL